MGMDKGERESFVLCGLIKGGGRKRRVGFGFICVLEEWQGFVPLHYEGFL